MRPTTTLSTLVRRLAVLLAATLAVTLLPATTASAQSTGGTQLCPDPPPVAGFDDRSDAASVHRTAIDCLAYLGIAEGLGYEEGTRYLPLGEVRRDQMASFIARSLEAAGATLPAPEAQGFVDVSADGNVHADRIHQLAQVGIAEGRSADRFAPGAAVSRDQMASFLLRAIAWFQDVDVATLAGGPTRFDDVSATGNVHAERIAGVYHLGVAQGVTGTTYEPAQAVNRQQMATFLVRTLDAMHRDPQVCTNHRDGYTLTVPAAWVTNPGDVEPRCVVFDTERFVLQPATELPADASARITVEPIGYQAAADEDETRDELDRRDDTAGDRDAIVVTSEATGDGLAPAGTRFTTWYVDASTDGQERTLIATTDTRNPTYEADVDRLDELMGSLVLGVPRRTAVASYEGGGQPFTVAGWVSGQAGLCTQATAGAVVSTVCATLPDLDELEVRRHDLGDGFVVLAGSVDDTIDEVEVVSDSGDTERPELALIWSRQAFATGIPYDDVDVVRAIRDGEVVVTADLP